jgi:hypothetical protein
VGGFGDILYGLNIFFGWHQVIEKDHFSDRKANIWVVCQCITGLNLIFSWRYDRRMQKDTSSTRSAKRLSQTGGGLGGNDDDGDDSLHEYMSCYIPHEGSDQTTTEEAKNLWGNSTSFAVIS